MPEENKQSQSLRQTVDPKEDSSAHKKISKTLGLWHSACIVISEINVQISSDTGCVGGYLGEFVGERVPIP